MKDLNFCLNHNGTDTQGRPIYASNGPGVCRKLPMDAAYTSMLRADVLNDCTWLAEAGIMDYSMMVGIGHLEFSTSTEKPSRRRSTPDGPDIFRRRSAPRPRMAKKSNSISFLKIDTNVEDLASITAECGDCSRSIDCNSNSIHSSLQNVVQSVPWRSVWQEHWVSLNAALMRYCLFYGLCFYLSGRGELCVYQREHRCDIVSRLRPQPVHFRKKKDIRRGTGDCLHWDH